MLVLIAEVNGWRPQITSQILKSEVAAVLADMGVSGGTAGSGRRERDDSGEILHGCKRSDYWRLLERAREGRTKDRE